MRGWGVSKTGGVKGLGRKRAVNSEEVVRNRWLTNPHDSGIVGSRKGYGEASLREQGQGHRQ